MVLNVQKIISDVVNRKAVIVTEKKCKCGNVNLFHFNRNWYKCDDCNIDVKVLKNKKGKRWFY